MIPFKNNLKILLNKGMLFLLKMKLMMNLNKIFINKKIMPPPPRLSKPTPLLQVLLKGKIILLHLMKRLLMMIKALKKVKTRIQRIKMVKKLSPPQGRQLKLVVKLALQSLWNLEHYLSTRSLVIFEQGSPHEVN